MNLFQVFTAAAEDNGMNPQEDTIALMTYREPALIVFEALHKTEV